MGEEKGRFSGEKHLFFYCMRPWIFDFGLNIRDFRPGLNMRSSGRIIERAGGCLRFRGPS